MTAILVVSGTIAALICFRWMRTAVMVAIALAALWVVSAHAQEPIVQCHVGLVMRPTLAHVCPVLQEGHAALVTDGSPNIMKLSVLDCARVIARHSTEGVMQFVPACTRMWSDDMHAMSYLRATGR